MCTAKLPSTTTGSSYSQPHINSLPPRRVRPTPVVCNEFLRDILPLSLRLRICKGVQTAVSNSGIATGRPTKSNLARSGEQYCRDAIHAREGKGGPMGSSEADAAAVSLSLNPQNCANFKRVLRSNETALKPFNELHPFGSRRSSALAVLCRNSSTSCIMISLK